MKFWQVDAFTNEPFKGNPAGVFIFDEAPLAELMQNIAREMNLSETAFVIKKPTMTIRWFTPNAEVNLCGHATLAAAHILWEKGFLDAQSIEFQSRSGMLAVTKNGKGYALDFPAQPPSDIQDLMVIREILGLDPVYVGTNKEDCMAVVQEDSFVRGFTPDFDKICQLDERGFLLTAQDSSGKFDYIYRAFFPKLDVPEDPVTGSANTCLAPYWANKLNKKRLKARQISERGGNLDIEVMTDRVVISGEAVTVIEGEFFISSYHP